jgi:hypothetical protein
MMLSWGLVNGDDRDFKTPDPETGVAPLAPSRQSPEGSKQP